MKKLKKIEKYSQNPLELCTHFYERVCVRVCVGCNCVLLCVDSKSGA